MNEKRVVKIIEDDKGRKLLMEVSTDAEPVDIATHLTASDQSPFVPIGAKERLTEVKNSLAELIRDTTSSILEALPSQEISQPAKIIIEFGVEVAAEGQAWFIAKGSAKSTIKVAIEWNNLSHKPPVQNS